MKRWMHSLAIILSLILTCLANIRIYHFTGTSSGLIDWICKIPIFVAVTISGNPHTFGSDWLFYLIEIVYYFILVEIVLYAVFGLFFRRTGFKIK